MSIPNLTQLAAEHILKVRLEDLTPEVETKALTCLLDYLGALISGLSAPWSKALLNYARTAISTTGTSTVIGLDGRVPADIAAFVNASIAHRQVPKSLLRLYLPTAVA
jgi:2-methylcitrate dehydratase PrpD